MRVEPLVKLHKSDVKGDRWSFGGNLAYEYFGINAYGFHYKEYYLSLNFLFWNLALGISTHKNGNEI